MSLWHGPHISLPALALVTLCAGGGLTACVANHAQPLDALTTPEPDALRERAMRRLSLATAYFEQNQNTAAQQEVRAALQIDPEFADAYNLLGLIHQRDNASSLAEQSFVQALRLAGTRPAHGAVLASAQHNYGWFLCEQARYAEAQTQFTRALTQSAYRQPAKTWMAMGLCQRQAGQPADARLSFEHALQLDSRNPIVRYQLASLDQATQPSRAQAVLQPLNHSADATAASLSLGIELAHALGQAQEAKKLLAQLALQFPQSTQAKTWIQKIPQDQ